MGLLDDAIREHLDLKRRHGADPTEVERAEREALGPVRRGPDVADDPSAAPDLQFERPPSYEEEDEEYWEAEPLEDERDTAEPRESIDHEEYDPPRATRVRDSPPTEEPSPERQAEPPPANSVPRSGRHVDAETAEFQVEFDHEGEQEGEDVLEETPEFLQDAPDHDRLWFEQRPPRDFDFDG